MDNYNRVQEINNELLNAAGTTNEQYARYLDSVEAAGNRARVAMEQFYLGVINSDAIKHFYNLSAGIFNVANSVGSLRVILIGLISVLLLSNKYTKGFITNLQVMPFIFRQAAKEATGLKAITLALGTAFDVAKIKAVAMQAALTLGLSLAITLAIEAVTRLIGSMSELRHKNEELLSSYQQAIQQNNEHIKSLQALANEYDNLKNKTSPTLEEHKRLIEIQNEIARISPSVVHGYDDQGNAVIALTGNIQDLIEELKEYNRQEAFKLIAGGESAFKEMSKDVADAQKQLDLLNQKIANARDIIEHTDFWGKRTATPETIEYLTNRIAIWSAEAEVLGNQIRTTTDRFRPFVRAILQANDAFSELDKTHQDMIQRYILESDFISAENYEEIYGSVRRLIDNINSANFDPLVKQVQDLNSSFKDGTINQEQYEETFNQIIVRMAELTKLDPRFLASIFQLAAQEAKELQDSIETLSQAFSTFSSHVSKVESLYTAYNKLASGQQLSVKEVIKLVEENKNLINALETKDGILTLNIDKLKKEIDIRQEGTHAELQQEKAKLEAHKLSLETELNGLLQAINGNLTLNRVRADGIQIIYTEIKALQALYMAEAQSRMAKGDVFGYTDYMKKAWEVTKQGVEVSKLLLDINRISGNITGIDTLISALDNLGSSFDSASSSIKNYISKLESFYNELRQIEDKQQRLNFLQKERQLLLPDDEKRIALFHEELTIQRELVQLYEHLNKLQQQSLRDFSAQFKEFSHVVKVSDDYRSLNINMAEYNRLSSTQKEKLDGLISGFDTLSKAVNASAMAMLDAQIAIHNLLMSLADEIESVMKASYQKRSKAAVEAINAEMKALEKAHKRKIEMLDEELNKYTEIINAKLRELEDEEAKEDYQRQLMKMQQERGELQQKIDVLALDDSFEARAKRHDLEKELAQKEEEIELFMHKRSIELRKQSLKDQLENHKKEIDAKKTAEQKKYDAEKEALEQRKQATERYYSELLAAEGRYADLRRAIVQGNTDEIISILDEFINYFSSITEESAAQMGVSYQKVIAIIKELIQIKQTLEGMPDQPVVTPSSSAPPSGSTGTGGTVGGSVIGAGGGTPPPPTPYVRPQGGTVEYNNGYSHGYNDARGRRTRRTNFSTVSYAYENGYNAGYQAGLEWRALGGYHSGGIAGDGSDQYHSGYDRIPGGVNNRISKLINDLFQKKDSGEIFAKLLSGEPVIHPLRGLPNFQSNFVDFMRQISNRSSDEIGSQSIVNYFTFKIDKLQGDEKAAEKLANLVFQKINRYQERVGKR
ncbi:MAG: hypothetical protein WDA59_06005 [Methanofastidiosum sp.]